MEGLYYILTLILGEPQTMVGYVLLDVSVFVVEILFLMLLFLIPWSVWVWLTRH